jgi:iron-sulfur cluster insertion protein
MSNITFTPAAAAKVKEIIAEENNPSLKLRVFVQGGGCAGFQYGFTLDDVVNEDDYVSEHDGVSVLVDPSSMLYLFEATVDFTEDLTGAQFKIANPNATSTCGCGSSFSTT